jgi:lipopolysaccharide transport system permease protein
VLSHLKTIIKHRELIINFTIREIKAKYKQAVLGIGWALLQPIMFLSIMTMVFSIFARMPSDGKPYPLFLFSASLPWLFFNGAITRGTSSLSNQSHLIRKIYFPREILVLASLLAAMVDFAIVAILYFFMLAYYQIVPTLDWILLFPVFLIETFLALGLMMFLAPMNVFYKYIGHLIPTVMQLWMYITPIMYPLKLVPEEFRDLYFINPLVGIMDSYRKIMLFGQLPDWEQLGYSALIAFVLLILGYCYFKYVEMKLADIA